MLGVLRDSDNRLYHRSWSKVLATCFNTHYSTSGILQAIPLYWSKLIVQDVWLRICKQLRLYTRSKHIIVRQACPSLCAEIAGNNTLSNMLPLKPYEPPYHGFAPLYQCSLYNTPG